MNHGISEETVNGIFAAGKEFFALPEEQKNEVIALLPLILTINCWIGVRPGPNVGQRRVPPGPLFRR
jgi:hypothetical protein